MSLRKVHDSTIVFSGSKESLCRSFSSTYNMDMQASNKKSILVLSVLVLSFFLLTSCLLLVSTHKDIYSSDYWNSLRSPSNSKAAFAYLLSDIVPNMDAGTKEEISDIFTKSSLYATKQKDSVTITNYYSNLMVKISKTGISMSLSYELPVSYSVGYDSELYLLGTTEDLVMDLRNYIIIKQGYNEYGSEYHYEYVKDLALPSAWTEYLISRGEDGESHKGGFWFHGNAYSSSSYYWEIKGLDQTLLRIAYLVDQYFKNYSAAKDNVSKKLKSLGTTGSSVLGKIESGQISLYADSEVERLKAKNIILEQSDNTERVYICDDFAPNEIRAANVFCDGEQFFVMEASAYIVNGSFEYPIDDSELIQALSSAKKVYIEYYDDGYMTIMTKDLITSDDKQLLSLYSIL